MTSLRDVAEVTFYYHYIVEDVFYIIGRGYVLYIKLQQDLDHKTHLNLFVGDKISFSDDEEYEIAGIERAMLLLSTPIPSPNVGILIRGSLKNDKNTYIGKEIRKYIK